MPELTVQLGNRSYPVLLDDPRSFVEVLRDSVPAQRYAVVTNDTIAGIYGDLLDSWRSELDPVMHIMPDGEQYKHIGTWKEVLDTLLEARLDRGTVIIALGGGVIGDIAGFAAASFLRGVRFVQVPTTLLAMVDSSVGGKTGVNHSMGKNLIGAFHQPSLVWIDTKFLATLPQREFRSGYAEVFKTAFIGGRDAFDFITDTHDRILQQQRDAVCEAIRRSVEIKAGIVAEDEREAGKRALLNFGHTFAHALEKYYDYTGILHGEAVHWGMHCAIDLARRTSMLPKEDAERYDAMIGRILHPQLPTRPTGEALFSAMFSDKKVSDGKLRFILPTVPGTSEIRADIPRSAVMETLEEVFGGGFSSAG
jgi:3-dehydroquinate synthase